MSEETKKQLNTMKEKVLEAIQTDEVTMRSRYYFVARSALWILGTILAFGFTLYFASLIGFVFRSNGLHLLPHLGASGWFNLFVSLPWVLLLVVFTVFVLLQVLSTHFSFVYKRPLVHTILGSIFVLIIGGVALAQTTLHDRMYRFSQERNIPFAAPMYRDAIRDRGDVHVGVVEDFSDTEFILVDRKGSTYTIKITNDTRIPPRGIDENTTVIVIGEESEGRIEAHGVRPFDKNKPPFLPHKEGKEIRGVPPRVR